MIAAGLIRDILSLVNRYYHRPRLENYVSIKKMVIVSITYKNNIWVFGNYNIV